MGMVRGTGHFEYSSLVGEEKKKLLKLLPQILLEKHILHAETEDMVAKIWAEFANPMLHYHLILIEFLRTHYLHR